MPRILICEPDKDPQPYRFGLDAGTVHIGRAAGNDIVLTCGSISGHHASMERVPGGFRLVDHASTNGVFRGAERIPETDLAHGDALKLGDVGFEFQLSDEEIASLAAEFPAKTIDDALPEISADAESHSREHPTPTVRIPVRISFFQVVVLLVLAAVAFGFGMAQRHKNDFGIPLWEAILRGHPAPEKSPEEPADAGQSGELSATPDTPIPPQAPETVPEELEGWEQRDREAEESAEP